MRCVKPSKAAVSPSRTTSSTASESGRNLAMRLASKLAERNALVIAETGANARSQTRRANLQLSRSDGNPSAADRCDDLEVRYIAAGTRFPSGLRDLSYTERLLVLMFDRSTKLISSRRATIRSWGSRHYVGVYVYSVG